MNANATDRLVARTHTDTPCIVIHSPGGVGATSVVGVKGIQQGFDWDAGKLLITPEVPLTPLTPDQVTEITKSVRLGQSWHAYQRHKGLLEQIDLLKRRLTSTSDNHMQTMAFQIADEAMIALIKKRFAPMKEPDVYSVPEEPAGTELEAIEWLVSRGLAAIIRLPDGKETLAVKASA